MLQENTLTSSRYESVGDILSELSTNGNEGVKKYVKCCNHMNANYLNREKKTFYKFNQHVKLFFLSFGIEIRGLAVIGAQTIGSLCEKLKVI